MKALRERQRKAIKWLEEEEKRYEAELAKWETEYAAWKRDKKNHEEPPEKPEPPQAERCLVSDTTVEALAPILKANPRGLILARDELSGWLGSFDRYVGGKGGADASHWLSMYNGETIIVDRRTGHPSSSTCIRLRCVLRAAFSRAFWTEPSAVSTVSPVSVPGSKRWPDHDIDPAIEDRVAKVLDWLFDLRPVIDDKDQLQPVIIGMKKDA